MEDRDLPKPPPESGSKAALSYFWTSQCDFRLLTFVIDTVLRSDLSSKILDDAIEGRPLATELSPAKLALDDPGPRVQALRGSKQELLEMFLGRAVDNFQVYIVEILREVLHKQPRILSASKQELTLGYVLQFDSIESLARDWIEGKVSSLSYEGFGDLDGWCQSKGIPLLVPEGKREQVVELIATRNLIVHNRGIVDERYRKAVPTSPFPVGVERTLKMEDLLRAKALLDQVVSITDSAVVGKFSLETDSLREKIAERSSNRWPPPAKRDALPAKLGESEETGDKECKKG